MSQHLQVVPTCTAYLLSCSESKNCHFLSIIPTVLRLCSHLFRFAFRSRSSPVPLVRVAFTPGKIDWNGSGFGPVARSHLFRNATGTSSPVNTPHPTTPAHQVFRLDVKLITCALIQHGCLACRVLLRVYLDKQSSANS